MRIDSTRLYFEYGLYDCEFDTDQMTFERLQHPTSTDASDQGPALAKICQAIACLSTTG